MSASQRTMTGDDFIYLNVPAMIGRYENPSMDWHEKISALATTQINLFLKYGLLSTQASTRLQPVDEVVIKFSDFSPLGQAFIRTGAVERWLASCDRKASVEAYLDQASLERRILAFLEKGASTKR